MPRKTRISLDFAPEGLRLLHALQARLSEPTYLSLFRKSLALLDLVTDAQEQGGKVVIRNKDGSEEAVRIL